MFKNGWTSVTNAELSEHPSTSTSDDKQEQSTAVILDNRKATIRNITTCLDTSQGSAHTTVHDILGYDKVYARLVPSFLHKSTSTTVNISSDLLQQYHNRGEHFLITSLEMRPGSTIMTQKANTKVCNRSTQHQVMHTVFWYSKRSYS
jgi:hypothetical protein